MSIEEIISSHLGSQAREGVSVDSASPRHRAYGVIETETHGATHYVPRHRALGLV